MVASKSRTVRLLGALLGVALIISGCGGAKPAEKATTPAPAAAAPAQPEAPKTRKVKHAMGESEVPAQAKRVVVLDTGELDMVLALGVKPVGAVIAGAESDYPEYLKGKTDGIQKVGTVTQPNLETIAALKPDLIISSKMRHEKIYDQLSKIAPTVFAERTGYTWKEQFSLYAEALGKSKEAEAVMAGYYKRMDEFKKAMGDRLGTTRVSLLRSLPDNVRVYMAGSFSGTILKDAGLPRPQGHEQAKTFENANAERIPFMDGDVIFTMYYGREKGESLSKIFQNPLWKQLNAVKNNRVYEIDDGIWGLGIGPIAANLVIDDLFKYLVNTK